MPFVIALTGGIGSGKSTVTRVFAELGAGVIDTDVIAHQLTAAGQTGALEIGRQFGAEFLGADGTMDRDRMRKLVFADPSARKKLEAILHPLIRAEVDAALRRTAAPYLLLVVPLLVETGAYRERADRILVVDCSESDQIARVVERNGHSTETVRGIMASQASRAQRLAVADDVITNDADLATLQSRSAVLHQRYLALAAAAATPPNPAKTVKKTD
jgi:dephospho-CoA kinase